ncbi:MAG: IS1 family transposase [Alphaproteobacteria bacterium]
MRIEVDEMHSFVGRRAKNARPGRPEGAYWIWTALCSDTKIIPVWRVGPRNARIAQEFIVDLAPRLKNRVQLTSDGLTKYPDAIEYAFGPDIDYGMVTKQYDGRGRYIGAVRGKKIGNPDPALIGTSYIERSNLTLRMGCRRFARRTNAHSKTLENHRHALALHFMYYNFARVHGTLRVAPAMEAGVSDRLWSLEDIARLA